MSIIIKGGTLVTESDIFTADLAMDKGTIVAIGSNLTPQPGTEAIDARGKYVMPGGIDSHVHLQLPFCGTISADDFENGTKAAACGGVTTVTRPVTVLSTTKRRPVISPTSLTSRRRST
ncbi:MAG: amidohydrolase family protein [Candidatus Aureabacteria bacterium]|nr:amidohydrolase family protein [Candidatus Auribacterota bacterium]